MELAWHLVKGGHADTIRASDIVLCAPGTRRRMGRLPSNDPFAVISLMREACLSGVRLLSDLQPAKLGSTTIRPVHRIFGFTKRNQTRLGSSSISARSIGALAPRACQTVQDESNGNLRLLQQALPDVAEPSAPLRKHVEDRPTSRLAANIAFTNTETESLASHRGCRPGGKDLRIRLASGRPIQLR
jgi:hypothetical protein